MKIPFRSAVKTFIATGLGWLFTSPIVHAQVNTNIGDNIILGNTSPVELAILILNWALGILALLAVGIILWGGFIWLLSNGDDEKIVKAKAILRNGLIGLTIILAAWGIATYVINLLLDVTNAGDTYYTPPIDPGEDGDGSPFYIDHSNPADGDTDVPLCHIIAVSFSYPLNESTVTSDSFVVTVPYDAVSNPDGGKGHNEACTANAECLSGACSDAGRCDSDQLAGSFDFSESVFEDSESGYVAVFYPAADYEVDTTYAVEITTEVEGIDPETGAVYNLTAGDAKRNFAFTTGSTTDITPPTVDVVSVEPYPYDNDTEICLNPTLQVTFSESLDPASPDDENFWLYQSQDLNGDGVNDDPADMLDISYIRFNSLGGEADDTVATQPQNQLSEFTEYGINLYSGDALTENFDGAIYDTCGNPLSGDFDVTAEGHPTDDFVDSSSAGLSQAFCSCTGGVYSCNVAVGGDNCTLADATTCTLAAACSSASADYVGYEYQWTWETGDEPYCIPEIDSFTQTDYYYSEDNDPTASTGYEDSGLVRVSGNYLYPLYDLLFFNNISALDEMCFDATHDAQMACFVDSTGTSSIVVRTPVSSQTGRLTASNADGSDTSAVAATINSPYILNTSPLTGPVGQYVTIRGHNFLDYDPSSPTSSRGHVYFDGVEAEVMCDDGWDDDQIIVRVPDSFVAADIPNIQVVAVGDYYSNKEAFTVSAGDPGPGLCEIDPACSDTGTDNITAIGENFGDSGTVYFQPNGEAAIEGDVSSWNVYNTTYESYTAVTNQTPVTEPDDYTFYASNTAYYSNGLDFNITCSIPPEVFEYFQCDLENTYYLPNPLGFWDNACVNSDIYFAFDQLMLDSSVTSNVVMYKCNSGDTYDDTTCTTPVTATFDTDYLNNAYVGGDGSITMDGSVDIDGDSDTDVYDGYSAYTLNPATSLEANYYYKIVVPITVTNANNTPLAEEYSWHFRVRNDSNNCVADYLAVTPYSETENNYDSTNACLDNYSIDGTSYSLRARPLTSDCLVLDDAGNYTWSIDVPDIIGFGDNTETGDVATSAIADTSTRGYNTVCLQGEEQDNTGTATVLANILDPSDSSVAATDDALVTVDFGFCTQDSDCYTQDCRDTYCDPATSHCAPDVISFSDDATSGQDVGPGGCVTLNGCYFGTDQGAASSCSCTETLVETLYVNPFDQTEVCDDGNTTAETNNDYTVWDVDVGHCVYTDPDNSTVTCNIDVGDASCTFSANETCSVAEGGSTCLLDDRVNICSLGARNCSLADTCSSDDAVADYSLGYYAGCTCSASTTDTLYVDPANTGTTCATTTANSYTTYDSTLGYCVYTDPSDSAITCNITVGQRSCTYTASESCTVADGASSCTISGDSACSPTSSTYTAGDSGSVTFNSTSAAYPNSDLCGDIWDNDQVIAQVPDDGSLPAGAYSISLNSYYNLSDTYGTAAGDSSDCTVGTGDSPCLCKVEPDSGPEGELVDLFGEHFNLLTDDGGEVVTFKSSTSRIDADAGTEIGTCSDTGYSTEATCTAASETWTSVITSTWVDDGSCSDSTYITEATCTAASETWTTDITTVTDAPVPEGAISSANGVRLDSDNYRSNSLEFTVLCSSNLDCSTGCCFEGQCSAAETCNACADDTDCTYGSCLSACISGTCAPYVVDVSPKVGAVGQPVTIQGCYFGTYYDPAVYTTGSAVTVDGITADLACNETDSWNNLQIIATIPDGIFTSDTDTTGEVQVQQVTTVNDAQVAQLSNTFVFTEDNSCSAVNLPVLCNATPAYSPYQTLQATNAADIYPDIDLEGENFYAAAGGYCTCQLETLGSCTIPKDSASCTTTVNTTYYVNPEYTSETCSDGSSSTASTNNAYTVYNGDPDGDPTTNDGTCVYTDLTDSSVTCNIAVGHSTCTYTESETCQADEADIFTTCTSAISSFVSLDGAVEYNSRISANLDWAQYNTAQYVTDVPDDSETGDVYATATTGDGVACVSNGLEFPVTCNSCNDCIADGSDAQLLNCNLDYDPAFGACTSETTGYCRADTSSCCGTSCVYDYTDTTDLGTCAPIPSLVLDDTDGDDMSDALENQEGYDSNDTDSDDDGIIDSDENGTTTGNTDQIPVASDTTPEPGATSVCPNVKFQLEFDIPIITAEAFSYNDNDSSADDPEADLTADDIALDDIEFNDRVFLHRASVADTATSTLLSDVTVSADQKKLTLELDSILAFSTQYEIIIRTNDSVQTGTNHQGGIVSAEYGTALGCSSDQAALGLCNSTNHLMRIGFTTISAIAYQRSCGPAYTILDANSEDFVDASYTFTEVEQDEDFTATVYSAGVDILLDNGTADADGDGVDDGTDDQAIQRIDDGIEAGFWWAYDWDPVYASLEDLESSSCPIAGIITADDVGSCACTVEESCTITEGDDTCLTSSGVTCETDSPSLICDSLDSGYATGVGCACTVTDSCDITAAEATCAVTINEKTVTCTTDSPSGVCDENDSNWTSGSFTEDNEKQTVTADSPEPGSETTDDIAVTVTGDGSVEDGWGNAVATSDDLTDSVLVDVQYCADPSYLVTYSNSDYNFYWSYCRGADPQSTDFLPELERAFYRSDTTAPSIDTAYGDDMDFIYEVAFKDANALTNDPTTNNNTIAFRIYPNNLDGDTTTNEDSVSPDLWYLLNTNEAESGYSATTVDGYQAVSVGNTTYVAIMDYVDASAAYNPYVFVIAYSTDADPATQDTVDAILEGLRFNRNTSLSNDCAIEKEKVVRDTKRVNDLGTVAYLLSSYYYNDSDGNGVNDFPDVATGSYIAGLSTSIWPSWDATLGNLLGQSLPTDSDNTFYEATTSCPYDPPDVSAGETIGTYYDESGTCWDPVLKDFYGPAGSYTYLYQYLDSDKFNLYANLERKTGTADNVYDPCSTDVDGVTAVDPSISSYSDDNCKTYDYYVDEAKTTDKATYADLF